MEMDMGKHNVIILAGGSGSRMNSNVPKQYLELKERPVLAYSLLAFEHSFVDEIILVCRKGEEEYCRKEYVEKYHLKKVTCIVPGGAERYLSVQEGLKKIKNADYIWIHDGARPFVTKELLERLRSAAEEKKAVVPGVRVKDTIKQTDEAGRIIATVPRENLWNIQTPQVFSGELIQTAYRKLMESEVSNVTDDGMVVEKMMEQKVWIVEGDYDNIKITTPEDMEIGAVIVGRLF
jgi:2-C-methyl-D-erythritol 4-phosphate cytidylyltransferase